MAGTITDKDRITEGLGYPSLTLVPQGGMVALAGGAQAGTPIQSRYNRFVTVASAADSGQLLPALPGRVCFVKNAAAANSMNVFPQTGEVINALAANAAFGVVAGKSCEFYCITSGIWETNLSA